ncbi:MAG TPA: aminoglycoside 6-adenylyltransferase [Candidatus Mediterraneibacter colneyensis]|nr:aminoglycoside 6-adenylyltransferase [Candidatus Mediterraneibacter colneyensis]
MKRYLPEDVYRLYREIFPAGDYGHFWHAIRSSCRLFRETAVAISESLGMAYPEEYERGFKRYMEVFSGKQTERENYESGCL